jgi:hypothetical protein
MDQVLFETFAKLIPGPHVKSNGRRQMTITTVSKTELSSKAPPE